MLAEGWSALEDGMRMLLDVLVMYLSRHPSPLQPWFSDRHEEFVISSNQIRKPERQVETQQLALCVVCFAPCNVSNELIVKHWSPQSLWLKQQAGLLPELCRSFSVLVLSYEFKASANSLIFCRSHTHTHCQGCLIHHGRIYSQLESNKLFAGDVLGRELAR